MTEANFEKPKDIVTTKVVDITNVSIAEWIAPYDVKLTGVQIDQVRKYISLLLQWNQKISLTSIENPQEIVSRHFGESFFGSKFIENHECRLADVGSGAGFPGLPIKIVRPELQVFLIEQDTRKATFLNEVIRLLNMENIKVLRSPYEAIPPDGAKFDVITTRAVGNHKALLKWSASRLDESGKAVLWLGSEDANLASQLPGWQWELPSPLPNSRNRVLLIGSPRK